MKRQESDRFDDDRKEEPYHRQHDTQGFRPHATGGDCGIHHQNVGFGGGGGGFRGFSRAQFPRKRNFSSSECPDGSDVVKLFVGGIARTTTEEEIRRVFEKYGDIIEVVMVQDKKTSKQHEYCFVKYFSMEAADRAIAALNNEFLFPGGTAPIRVRFADGEKERIVAAEIQHKLYVCGLNKQASKEEIIEIFTSYGLVEDVYLLLDDLKQRRGCGFVTFSHREMAVAAINGLHGTYVMKGCDQSLIVRFADPKKPRIRELREAPDSRDFHGGTAPGSFHFGNLGAPPYENAAIMGAEAPPPFANMIQPPSSSVIHQLNHHQAIPFQIPSVQGQGWNGGSQPFNGAGSEVQTALNHGSILLLGDSRMAIDQSSDSTSQRQMVPTASVETNGAVSSSQSASSGLARCDSVEDAPDCDWSEHTCPDGYKYYFNCMTYESRWEKPKEYTLYEEQLHKSEQQLRSLSGTQVQPLAKLDVLSDEQSSLVQAMESQSGSLQLENGLKLMSCAEEHIQEKSTADADLVISPALVQQ